MTYDEALTSEEVQYFLAKGLTPRVVEHAYKYHITKELKQKYKIHGRELTALAKRWGINRNNKTADAVEIPLRGKLI